LSALASAVLRSQRAHDKDSWQHGSRRGYEDGWKKGKHAGYSLGLEKGLEQGQEAGAIMGQQQGLAEGIEAGKRIIELRPGRAVQAQGPQVDHNLFAKWRFLITPEVEQEVRDKVAEHLKGQEPSGCPASDSSAQHEQNPALGLRILEVWPAAGTWGFLFIVVLFMTPMEQKAEQASEQVIWAGRG
jgi:hypothetical protein